MANVKQTKYAEMEKEEDDENWRTPFIYLFFCMES